MIDDIELVNHEVWFEYDGVLVLKWGHFPNVDGKIDPLCITRAFALANGKVKPAFVGLGKSLNGLFVEYEGEVDAVAIEYDRGIYSLTDDGRWFFGRRVPSNCRVEEVRHILGFAKVHFGEVKPLGLELEIVLDGSEGEGVKVLFRGKPVDAKVKLRNTEGTFELDAEEIRFAEGVNVLSARFVDDLGFVKRSLVTTLTVLV